MNIKPKVSIILVHYKESGVLYDCIRSIYKSSPKVSFEIIVVDNDEIKIVNKYLKKNFPKIRYIAASGNLGYGKGNNLGIENARGEYVFVLNPDTLVEKGAVDNLLKFLENNKKVGIVAPTLYDKNGKMYPLQGTGKLTPLRGAVALSFLNKLFPRNPISKKYWMLDADRTKPYEVEVVPGTAFMIKRSLFEKIGGFDRNFFLYFEESDFCKRVVEKGLKLFILPEARVTHFWAVSTPPSDKIRKIFSESRFYYFKKNFGILNALIVEFFTRLSKWNLILFAIFALGTFLRFYRFLPNLLLNGEMGTDYMAVWNMIHGTRTWLIGPRTSHEWFFISPIAYWIYAALLLIWKYNPVVINIFWAVICSLAIFVCYYYVKRVFNRNIALISSFLMAVSPAWLVQARNARYNLVAAVLFFPYLLYLRDSLKDKGKSLFKLGLVLGLTMSFFPSPLLLIPAAIICFLFYGVKPKAKYIWNFVFGFLIPNITFIIYEFSDKFSMTIQLLTWIPYRILGFFGLYDKNTVNSTVLSQNFSSIYQFFSESFVGYEGTISIVIFILVIIGSLFLLKKYYKDRNREMSFFLVVINLLVCYLGLFVHGNPPDHYYLVIFPIPLILAAFILDNFYKKKFVLIISILIFGAVGILGLIKTNWFFAENTPVNYEVSLVPYTTQLEIIGAIYKNAGETSFSLTRFGVDDQFEDNYADNYIYLLTICGAKIDSNSKTRYTIIEGQGNYVKLPGTLIFSENQVYVFKTPLL
jgi:GT2 family glycosyltransferase